MPCSTSRRTKGNWPEIWIAAHGPRMLRAAGHYADGFYPAFPHTPEEYAQRLEAVRTTASDVGRDPMSIKPAIWFMTLAARNRDDLDEALDSEVIRAAALNAPDHSFARHGAQHPLGIGFTGAQDLLPQDVDEQTALSYVKAIPTEVVRDCLLCGTPTRSPSGPRTGGTAGWSTSCWPTSVRCSADCARARRRCCPPAGRAAAEEATDEVIAGQPIRVCGMSDCSVEVARN
ncbi:LLM class flavin-dependent oxidoreductase [Mycobacterium sp. CVI_P3]|uniref:LLM class flavin-dependent oxidoreductase n=1 Tax=Mycobacterium pinniadriaticum TaxID=2994102 RepID=A0ABT3SLZ9_9MYCO|nr:LLM class flavin-dependent oxidoreductase [Mycobacterium pinniadriaticum]MCX2933425.1 LLM class flavin-dependent oxidoreductase [Mycobacterium pinniadriaticum]MCX2939847.1 LLM class flavin-dependent oxidoreductase [Mycobacterium pinniadriaticum]